LGLHYSYALRLEDGFVSLEDLLASLRSPGSRSLATMTLILSCQTSLSRTIDYAELQELRKALKHHVESIEKHDHLIEALKSKLGEQGSFLNPLVELLMGILLTQRK
jgi:hypothetical protein